MRGILTSSETGAYQMKVGFIIFISCKGQTGGRQNYGNPMPLSAGHYECNQMLRNFVPETSAKGGVDGLTVSAKAVIFETIQHHDDLTPGAKFCKPTFPFQGENEKGFRQKKPAKFRTRSIHSIMLIVANFQKMPPGGVLLCFRVTIQHQYSLMPGEKFCKPPFPS